jgi:hypothetical protein
LAKRIQAVVSKEGVGPILCVTNTDGVSTVEWYLPEDEALLASVLAVPDMDVDDDSLPDGYILGGRSITEG